MTRPNMVWQISLRLDRSHFVLLQGRYASFNNTITITVSIATYVKAELVLSPPRENFYKPSCCEGMTRRAITYHKNTAKTKASFSQPSPSFRSFQIIVTNYLFDSLVCYTPPHSRILLQKHLRKGIAPIRLIRRAVPAHVRMSFHKLP